MIDESNLIDVLKALNFEHKSENVYKKSFNKTDCSIEVDFVNRKIIYPEEIQIMTHTTTNFDSPENFVVLECVTRLLNKGYRPKHIELEKTWTLGHTKKGGRSDICVSGTDEKILFIIECKTAGDEYDKEYKQMEIDGGQLFSYWHQERSCQWLVLYSSDFVDGEVKYTADSIDCHDSKTKIKHKNKKLYKDAGNVKELFEVWSKTHEKKFCGDVIFNDDTVAYEIGQKPLTKSRLIEFDRENKLVNKFEEILRHNNISDKENAFNRLMALFICKLTDESQKSDDDELEFQYRSGTDDFESFQDRLQRLYHEGMKEFMNEEIFYVANDYVYKTLCQYTDEHKRRVLTDELNKTMRHLKFYTNNDFAFKEIHNKKLFEQNTEILKEVVEKFQNYRIIGAKNLQFLGDLFEQLLNKGFKQNEGQFFTPIPIARFIWDSLPLEKVITSPEELPKIIDYACGAGHFLTQGFEAVNDFIIRKFGVTLDRNWVSNKLFGVEKDYRLARVSKISLFMHGSGNGNIIFGDGLENYPERNITNNTFDILVANPPYSVSAFKNHLTLSNADDFEVLSKISSEGSEIETLFVERVAQLLKPNGIAAVILPSSILNKENTSFIAARESILRNFNIRAIIQLGGKTFGATNTNTVVMFLEKFDEPPKRFDIVLDSLDAIFELRDLSAWEDKFIFKDWLLKINVAEETYKKFLSRQVNFDEWSNDDYFGKYYSAFIKSTAYLKKINQPSFVKMTDKDKLDWCNLKFYEFVSDIEREKIRYFACVYRQTTLVVTAPTGNKSQEKFLGYNWSERKRKEGLHTQSDTLLYNLSDREAKDTVAALVRNIFHQRQVSVDSLKDHYHYLRLQDMIDFTDINFNKVITTARPINFERKFNIIQLKDLVDVNLKTFNPESTPDKNYHYVDIGSINNNHIDYSTIIKGSEAPSRARRIANENDILISTVRPYLKGFAIVKSMPDDTLFSTGFAILSSKDENLITNEFIYCLFFNDPNLMEQMRVKMGKGLYPSINQNDISNFKILVPPLDIQKQIVSEFNKIEDSIQVVEDFLIANDEHIKSKFDEIFSNKANFQPLINLFDVIETGSRPQGGVSYYEEGAYSLGGEHINNTTGYLNLKNGKFIPMEFYDAANSGHIEKNDILLCKDGALTGKIAIVRNELNNVKALANEHIFVMKNSNVALQWYLFYYLFFEEGQQKIKSNITGMAQGGINRSNLQKVEIPLPSIEEQKKFAEYVQSIEEQKNEAINKKELLIAQRDELISKYFR